MSNIMELPFLIEINDNEISDCEEKDPKFLTPCVNECSGNAANNDKEHDDFNRKSKLILSTVLPLPRELINCDRSSEEHYIGNDNAHQQVYHTHLRIHTHLLTCSMVE